MLSLSYCLGWFYQMKSIRKLETRCTLCYPWGEVKRIVNPSTKAILAWVFSLALLAKFFIKKKDSTHVSRKEVLCPPKKRILDTLKNGITYFHTILQKQKPTKEFPVVLLVKTDSIIRRPIASSIWSDVGTEVVKEVGKEVGKKIITWFYKICVPFLEKIKWFLNVLRRWRRRKR